MTASVAEQVPNVDFGPVLQPTTPGCTGCSLIYSLSITPVDATCSAATLAASITFNAATWRLRTATANVQFNS